MQITMEMLVGKLKLTMHNVNDLNHGNDASTFVLLLNIST
jgi:hypothetical protein